MKIRGITIKLLLILKLLGIYLDKTLSRRV